MIRTGTTHRVRIAGERLTYKVSTVGPVFDNDAVPFIASEVRLAPRPISTASP